MAAIENRTGGAGASGDRREGGGRRAAPEFPLRQREFEKLLAELDVALHRSGLALGRQSAGGSDAASSIEDALPVDEQHVRERRAQVREVAAAMFLQLERRLTGLSRTFGRLSEEERVSLAALLRLPEGRRGVIGSMLRLPERDRKELSLGFRLSETECRALADLLDANNASPEARPTIRIVDASVAGERERPRDEP